MSDFATVFQSLQSWLKLFFAGKLLLNLMDHTDIVRDLTFAPDGSLMLVSASRDKTLRVWDLKDDGTQTSFSDPLSQCFDDPFFLLSFSLWSHDTTQFVFELAKNVYVKKISQDKVQIGQILHYTCNTTLWWKYFKYHLNTLAYKC